MERGEIMKFSKMNGIGNDYVYINLMEEKKLNAWNSYRDLAIRLSNRHFGIGADGIVIIDESKAADFSMRIFNADGTEAEMCGNAIRCVAKYVYDEQLTRKKSIDISTLSGTKRTQLQVDDEDKVTGIRVDMGRASLNFDNLDIAIDGKVMNLPIMTHKGIRHITCVSMGNPHAIIFADSMEDIDMDIAREISNNTDLFPERINVEFIKVLDKTNAIMRVYERGVGETLACGTGACASFYAGYIHKKLNKKAKIHLRGGTLEIEIINGIIFMEGTAELNYKGEIII